MVRQLLAAEWNLDPNRIGMLGFSAGGNLTAWAALTEKRHYDAIDDAALPAKDRTGVSVVLAMRPWELALFDKWRRRAKGA